MIIKKILNNSVIVANNDKYEEIIVMGKGIAFGLKVGSRVEQRKIDKIFSLNDEKQVTKFQLLLSDVPIECIEMTEEFVDYAKEKLGKKLHDSIYITLTEHFNTMIKRAKTNAYVENTLLWDISRLHSDEFKVSKKIIEKINKRIGSIYDDHEAATITLHFVNASLGLDISSTMKLTKVISDILNIVKYHFRVTYDEDSLYYYRFVVHLRFFAQRLFSGTTLNDSNDIEFMNYIQQKYQAAYQCTTQIKKYIFDFYQFSLADEECMYLAIHISKVVRESENYNR